MLAPIKMMVLLSCLCGGDRGDADASAAATDHRGGDPYQCQCHCHCSGAARRSKSARPLSSLAMRPGSLRQDPWPSQVSTSPWPAAEDSH